MGAYSTGITALLMDQERGENSDWCMCDHFKSEKDVADYYKNLGAVTFLDGMIMCEKCYVKVLKGEWKKF